MQRGGARPRSEASTTQGPAPEETQRRPLGRPAREIWLAGLGALAEEEEGSRLFSRLVGRGRELERDRRLQGEPEALSQAGLARIQQAFALSLVELGKLFGVSRQAASTWLSHGIPGGRLGKLATLLEISDLLTHQLKPGRLPGVARKPAAAYGGLNMLEMIEADRHEDLLKTVRRSFDWAASA